MPPDADAPPRLAIHATAVAIDGRGLLIVGPSKAGKSRLALALIATATKSRPIELVGDDRILLSRGRGGVVASPHPRIAGFIERRGLGILAMPYAPAAPVVGIVTLGAPETSAESVAALRALGVERIPTLTLAAERDEGARRDAVLGWWRGFGAANASHAPRKSPAKTANGS